MGQIEMEKPGASGSLLGGNQHNRYHSSRIVVRDRMLAQRRVSGVFLQSDASGAVQAIAQELGAQLLQLPGVVVFF